MRCRRTTSSFSRAWGRGSTWQLSRAIGFVSARWRRFWPSGTLLQPMHISYKVTNRETRHSAHHVQYEGGPLRSLEELKARYYDIARALLVGRSGGEDLIAHEPLVKHPFSAAHEQCALAVAWQCCSLHHCKSEYICVNARTAETSSPTIPS